jgi:hypothetical protein
MAQSQPCLTLLNTNPALRCSIPTPAVYQYHVRRWAVRSAVWRCGKAREYPERLWDTLRLVWKRYRVKQPESESGLSSTSVQCHSQQCAHLYCHSIIPLHHTMLYQYTANFTLSPSIHTAVTVDTLQLFRTLKRAHNLYVALKGNHYFNWHLSVSTACFELHAAWGSCKLY